MPTTDAYGFELSRQNPETGKYESLSTFNVTQLQAGETIQRISLLAPFEISIDWEPTGESTWLKIRNQWLATRSGYRGRGGWRAWELFYPFPMLTRYYVPLLAKEPEDA